MARKGLTEKDKQQIRDQVLKIGLYALREAKQRAPVDTGRLRSSITLADSQGIIQDAGPDAQEGDAIGYASTPFSVRIGSNVNYASHIEYGTVNQSPQPFLRPAIAAAFQKFNVSQ